MRIVDDTVAFADGVVEAGEDFTACGGFDPEAEPANLDGLGIEVHAVEVVLENLAVEIEDGALKTQRLKESVNKEVRNRSKNCFPALRAKASERENLLRTDACHSPTHSKRRRKHIHLSRKAIPQRRD
jgi:hypothetical protein